MKIASLLKDNIYKNNMPAISVLMETENTKEIKIVMKKGQVMKKHHAPFPIVIEVFDGNIDFGVENEILSLRKGDIISLKNSISHDLLAVENSIIRLSLSKYDQAERFSDVIE